MSKLELEKAEEPEIKLSISVGSWEKQENFAKKNPKKQKTAFASLTMPGPLTADHNTLWKILKEMGIPEHFICLL